MINHPFQKHPMSPARNVFVHQKEPPHTWAYSLLAQIDYDLKHVQRNSPSEVSRENAYPLQAIPQKKGYSQQNTAFHRLLLPFIDNSRMFVGLFDKNNLGNCKKIIRKFAA